MAKALKTNASVWSRVFRQIVAKVESDPDIRRVVGVDNIRSWRGSPSDKSDMVPSAGRPVVRLTPQPGTMDWIDNQTQGGDFVVRVEMAIQSLNIDDTVDLWDLFVIALRPCQPAFTQALRDAGAETGEIVFSEPAFDPKPEASAEGYFLAEGRMRLRIERPIAP